MKDDRDRSPDKPFYQNILDEKSRRHEKAKATAEARKARKEASATRDGDARRDSPGRRGDPAGRGPAPRGGKFAERQGGDRAFRDGQDRPPRRQYPPFSAPESGDPVFAGLSGETRKLLDEFPALVQSVMPLDSRKLQQLPTDIRGLSHELTDERSERRVGYMNEPPVLSAYIRYYMWWNLVRLTRLFAGLSLDLADGDAAVDLGSGPLTLPIALWIARPELRSKKLTWYCVDLSQNALAAGEELFLSLAAKTGHEPWQIVRIKGELGVSLRRRVRLVASANMFNELFWDNPDPIEAQAKRHAKGLASYAEDKAAVLLVEPGVPLAGRFVSLMRDSLLRLGFKPVSPCPHEAACPLPGLRGGKWCHFVFDTAEAPKALHKLSDDAGLSKDRAALSFLYALREDIKSKADEGDAEEADDAGSMGESDPAAGSPVSALERVSLLAGSFGILPVRITSDPIRLPDYRTGRYGCSEMGLVLVTGSGNAGKWLGDEAAGAGSASGSLLKLPRPAGRRPERDEKTGAVLISLDGGSIPSPRGHGDGHEREGRHDRDGGHARYGESRDRGTDRKDRDANPRDSRPARTDRTARRDVRDTSDRRDRTERRERSGPRDSSDGRDRSERRDRPFGHKPGAPRKGGKE